MGLTITCSSAVSEDPGVLVGNKLSILHHNV